MLAGAVDAQQVVGLVGGNAGGVDDLVHPAVLLLFFHLFGGSLDAEQHALDVDVEHAVELGVGDAFQRHHILDARVVDEDIHAAEGIDGMLDQGELVIPFGHVALEGRDRNTIRPEFCLGGFERLGVDVRKHDVETIAGQPPGNALAQTVARTRDDRYLVAHGCLPRVVLTG